jgi:integrase
MRGVIEKAGTAHLSEITRKVIVEGRDRRASTPAMARHFVRTMTGMFRWALDAEIIETDPTVNVSVPKQKTEGHHVWTVDEIQAFMERWPLGTRERLAFDVLLFTGLRRGDAVTLGKQHIRNGVITLKTEKTSETVRIPVLPMLAESIAAGPTGALAIIAGERGEPMTKESFGNWFGAVCRDTGAPGTAHGLRKALATIASEEGISEKGLDAVFGWRGGGMASLYTKTANRERLAADAMARLEQRLNALFPHEGKMREKIPKSK